MLIEKLQQIGLSKNEARVYESLLSHGESAVAQIAASSRVHRRNVYDSLNRLVEKGLVYEITHRKEGVFRAVGPKKLVELINEEEGQLDNIMSELEILYTTKPSKYEVQAYRGGEDFQNYMRDILRVNENVYFIGVMGSWLDKRWGDYFPRFISRIKKQNIQIYALFEDVVRESGSEIVNYFEGSYKFIPSEYATSSGIAVFGDNVHIFTELRPDAMPENPIWTVVVNKKVADSFRTWFKLMWNLLPEVEKVNGK